MIEGSNDTRLVRITKTAFEAMIFSRTVSDHKTVVSWGEPDEGGVYSPTIYFYGQREPEPRKRYLIARVVLTGLLFVMVLLVADGRWPW